MARSNKNRRRRIVVNKKLQGTLVLAIAWPVALCLALNIALMGIIFAHLTGRAVEAAPALAWLVPIRVPAAPPRTS